MDKTCRQQTKHWSTSSVSDSELEKKSGHRVLSISIKELSVLHSSYMPFLSNGGIFIPTIKQYEIGDEIFLLLNLIDEEEQIPVNGKVAWITPVQAQANRPSGVGVQFLEKNSEAKNKIENYLAGMLNSNKPTHTL
ncbi:PilZ domain-containing protein [Haliea sp. AH-315-K21]|uniref:Pilus assembly protein PilZ n=1 Tax=SAR86 cluster bacterium TaxID=2030880 RepID=A0A2A5CDZ1_9GAMM|nr:PilZ domain-containing protein [Haliea sp. AH-315-K21]MBN4075865.1 PilZ domain-containing protein [Gammaproteobacteria bacterium AH-315-E17]PCJ42104.1 MAG: pilus assembly protein PilZ [SAR86 cluster bacterium]